jgi:undecaprenyl-diphosphatase
LNALVSACESFKNIDKNLFLYLNSKHSGFWDVVMVQVSKEFVWVPLYLFLLYLIIKKKVPLLFLILMAVAVLIALSDQLSVHLFKNVFLRYRPTHNLDIQSAVHTVDGYKGGLYGFVSSHASNTFAIAMFVGLLLRKHYKYLLGILLVWASFVSYSRIYLGVHYPSDVVFGGLFGAGLAFLIYKLYIYILNKKGLNE